MRKNDKVPCPCNSCSGALKSRKVRKAHLRKGFHNSLHSSNLTSSIDSSTIEPEEVVSASNVMVNTSVVSRTSSSSAGGSPFPSQQPDDRSQPRTPMEDFEDVSDTFEHTYGLSEVVCTVLYLFGVTFGWPRQCFESLSKIFMILLHLPASARISHDQLVLRFQRDNDIRVQSANVCGHGCMIIKQPNAALCSRPGCEKRRSPQQFHYISLSDQIRHMFANAELAKLMRYRHEEEQIFFDGIRDFFDASVYQELRQTLNDRGTPLNSRDVIVSLYTDGVQVSEIPPSSCWPLLALNLNLPPKNRYQKDNLIELGIIPGPRSPHDINTFLDFVIDDWIILETAGFNCFDAYAGEMFNCRVFVLLCVCDIPARSKVMDMLGHNSMTPCSRCSIQGVYSGTHYYFPLSLPEGFIASKNSNNERNCDLKFSTLPARTPETFQASWIELQRARVQKDIEQQTGIKGKSALSRLKGLHFPQSFPVDVFHFLENILKVMWELWSGQHDDSTDPPDYVLSKDLIKTINSDMTELSKTSPSSFDKAPRPIAKHFRDYKATEWFNFLFVFGIPLLKGRLPHKYLKHFNLLRQALLLGTKASITRQELQSIKDNLETFVQNFEILYYRSDQARLHLCTFNLHLALHITETINSIGPLWVSWAFPMERYNGLILPQIRSQRYPFLNLHNNIIRRLQVNVHIRNLAWLRSTKTYGIDRVWEPGSELELSPERYYSNPENPEVELYYPKQQATLTDVEFGDLRHFYEIAFETRDDIANLDREEHVSKEIIRWGRLKTAGGRIVRSEFCGSARAAQARLDHFVSINIPEEFLPEYLAGGSNRWFGFITFFCVHEIRSYNYILARVRLTSSGNSLNCSYTSLPCVQRRSIPEGPTVFIEASWIDAPAGYVLRPDGLFQVVEKRVLFDS